MCACYPFLSRRCKVDFVDVLVSYSTLATRALNFACVFVAYGCQIRSKISTRCRIAVDVAPALCKTRQ